METNQEAHQYATIRQYPSQRKAACDSHDSVFLILFEKFWIAVIATRKSKKSCAKCKNPNLVSKVRLLTTVEQVIATLVPCANMQDLSQHCFNICKGREALRNKENRNVCAKLKSPFKAQYPLINVKFLDFIVYARLQRYPATKQCKRHFFIYLLPPL